MTAKRPHRDAAVQMLVELLTCPPAALLRPEIEERAGEIVDAIIQSAIEPGG